MLFLSKLYVYTQFCIWGWGWEWTTMFRFRTPTLEVTSSIPLTNKETEAQRG